LCNADPIPEEVVIERRFRGPPDSANGGYTCGMLARYLDPLTAEVTLRSPPPLGRPLRIEAGDGRATLHDGEVLVAEATPAGELDLELPEPPTLDGARAARAQSPMHEAHPFPSCFVCGPQRERGDGLLLTCGPVAGREVVAAPWEVDETLPGSEGRVAPEIMWAALDCPSGLAVLARGAAGVAVLGRLAARITDLAEVGRTYLTIGWALARDGRKLHNASAVLDLEGRPLGWARATWIELNPT
jgi:hypothetical protein